MPWSIVTEPAFDVVHESVDGCPGAITFGDAVNELMEGAGPFGVCVSVMLSNHESVVEPEEHREAATCFTSAVTAFGADGKLSWHLNHADDEKETAQPP